MARVFLFVGLLVLTVAIAVFFLSIWRGVYAAGQNLIRPIVSATQGEPMTPNGVQKVAYVALIVLLFGVASGWLGGL